MTDSHAGAVLAICQAGLGRIERQVEAGTNGHLKGV
jgi:hypothetical protein